MPDSIGTAFVDVAFDPKQISGQLGGLGAKTEGLFGKFGGVAGAAMVTGIGAAVAGGVAAGKYLYDVGKQFDDMSDTIRVATGKTGKDLDGLVKTAKGVGTDVPASFEDAGKAVSALSTRLGLTGKPLRTISDQVLELSRLSGTDLPTALNSVSRMLGDAGLKGAEASQGIDKLWRAAQATQVPVTRLADLLTKFGGPMRQLGFSFEEQAALLGKFEKEGVNTELVMGSMRIALGKMAKAGRDPVKGLNETIDAIKNAGSQSEANAKSIELFGARAGPDMAAAIREGRFSIRDLVKQIGSGHDTVMQASQDTRDFSENWQVFKNQVAVAVAPAAEKMFAAVGEGMGELTKEMPKLSKLLSREFGPALESLGPSFQTIGDALVDLMPLWKALGEIVLASMKIVIASVKGFVDILAGIIKVIHGLLTGDWAEAWDGAKQIVEGFVTYFKAIIMQPVTVLQQVLGLVTPAAAAIGTAILEGIRNGIAPIVGVVTTAFNSVVSFINGIVGAVRTAATAVGTAIKTGVESGVTGLGAFITAAFNGAVAIINGIVGGARAAASAVGTAIKSGVETGVTGIGAFVSSTFTAMAGIIRGVLGAVSGAAAAVGGAIKSGVVGAVTGIGGEISSVFGRIASTITGFVGRIAGAAHSVGAAIFSGVVGSVGDIAGAVWSALNRVYQTIQSWIDKIRGAAGAVGSALSHLNPFSVAPAPPTEGGGGGDMPAVAPASSGLLGGPTARGGTATGGTLYGTRSPLAGLSRAIASAASVAPTAAAGPVLVRVFIGDRELTDIVNTEVVRSSDGLARMLLAGATARA